MYSLSERNPEEGKCRVFILFGWFGIIFVEEEMFTLNHEKCTGSQYFNAGDIRYTYLTVLHSPRFYGCITNEPKKVWCRTMA